jgi:hypothetical protein
MTAEETTVRDNGPSSLLPDLFSMPFFSSLASALFKPPFRYLPALCLCFFLLVLILAPESQFRFFDPSDPDDYMRLVQVRDFLGGQNWFDVGQHRLAPGLFSDLHWSRLVDLPLAGMTLAFERLLAPKLALMATALLLPILLLGFGLMPMTMAFARPFVSRVRAAFMAPFLFTAAPALLYNFTPTRIGHHAYQLLIAAFGLYVLPRFVFCKNTKHLAPLAGLAFALALWIGVEAVPSFALFCLFFSLAAAFFGGKALDRCVPFGVTLALAALIELPLARPRADWFAMDVTWFSATYVVLACLAGGVFILLGLVGKKLQTPAKRVVFLFLAWLAALAAFAALAPRLFTEGPYGNLDSVTAPFILDHIGEAKPLAYFLFRHAAKNMAGFVRFLFIPLVSLALFALAFRRLSKRRRLVGLLICGYVVFFLATTLYYQLRLMTFLQLFTLPLALFGFWFLWDGARRRLKLRARFWAELAAFGFLGPLATMFIPVFLAGEPLTPAKLLFPALHENKTCSLKNVASVLNDPDSFGDRPRVIMNTMNDGPELLFRTNHSVLSASYGTYGNQESLSFFSAKDDAAALEIARRDNIDLVLICRFAPAFYTGLTKETLMKAVLSTTPGNELKIRNRQPTLFEKLVDKETPTWLRPVEVPFEKNYMLYEVRE